MPVEHDDQDSITVALSRRAMTRPLLLPVFLLLGGLAVVGIFLALAWSIWDGSVPAREFFPVALSWLGPLMLPGALFAGVGGWVIWRVRAAARDPRFNRWRMVLDPEALRIFARGQAHPATLTLHWRDVAAIQSDVGYVRPEQEGMIPSGALVLHCGPVRRRWLLRRNILRFRGYAAFYDPIREDGLVVISVVAVDTDRKALLQRMQTLAEAARAMKN